MLGACLDLSVISLSSILPPGTLHTDSYTITSASTTCMESTKGRRVSVRYRTAVPILSIAPPRRSTTTGCGKPGLPSNYPIMTLPIAYLRVSSWLHLLTQELLSRAWNRSVTVSDGFWPAHRIATGDFGFNLDCPDLFILERSGAAKPSGLERSEMGSLFHESALALFLDVGLQDGGTALGFDPRYDASNTLISTAPFSHTYQVPLISLPYL